MNFNNDWPATGSKVGPPGDGAKLQPKIMQNPKTEVNNDMAIRKADNDANTLMGGLRLKAKYQKTQRKLGQAVTTRTCITGCRFVLLRTHRVLAKFVLQWEHRLPWPSSYFSGNTECPGQVRTSVGIQTALAKFVLQWEYRLP